MAGKNAKPPPLPIETFERVIRVARFDGKMLVIIATTFAALAAMGRNAPPAIAGVIAAGLGLWEMRGAERLQNGDPKGIDAMIGAQLGLLATVFTYAGWMLMNFDPVTFVAQIPAPMLENLQSQLSAAGYSMEDLPQIYQGFNTLIYLTVAALTLVFQGMMVRFYHRARPAADRVIYGG
jgi:hypothetical protein